jgi:predicted dinucleotide-binding enzyme
MRIAVIGTGHVGGALGTGWARAGHDVIFGARDPKAADAQLLLSKAAGKAKLASIADAVAGAEVVVLAVLGAAVADALREIGSKLSGKILIYCTNPGVDSSAGSEGEQVTKLAPGAKLAKAFNTTGFENMENPQYGDGSVTMFYASDDANSKKVVHRLAKDLGFGPVDAEGLSQAHALELLAFFWSALAYGQKMGRGIAFRLLRRDS